MDGYAGKERREYLRYRYNKPMEYQEITKAKLKSAGLIDAMSKDLSVSGLLFATKADKAPQIGTLLVLSLDYRTAIICGEVEEKALILDSKLIGRVVRLEDNSDGTFDVGVAFVKRSDPISRNARRISDLIK